MKLFKPNLQKELERLYDSEINVYLQSFWDAEWSVALGDEINGFHKTEWDITSIDEIVPTLRELARKYYPNSEYVKSL